MYVRIQCIGLCRINIIIRGLSQDFAENPEAPANRNSPCSRVPHIDANGEVDGRGGAIACSSNLTFTTSDRLSFTICSLPIHRHYGGSLQRAARCVHNLTEARRAITQVRRRARHCPDGDEAERARRAACDRVQGGVRAVRQEGHGRGAARGARRPAPRARAEPDAGRGRGDRGGGPAGRCVASPGRCAARTHVWLGIGDGVGWYLGAGVMLGWIGVGWTRRACGGRTDMGGAVDYKSFLTILNRPDGFRPAGTPGTCAPSPLPSTLMPYAPALPCPPLHMRLRPSPPRCPHLRAMHDATTPHVSPTAAGARRGVHPGLPGVRQGGERLHRRGRAAVRAHAARREDDGRGGGRAAQGRADRAVRVSPASAPLSPACLRVSDARC